MFPAMTGAWNSAADACTFWPTWPPCGAAPACGCLPVRAAARVCGQRAVRWPRCAARPMPITPSRRRWGGVPAQRASRWAWHWWSRCARSWIGAGAGVPLAAGSAGSPSLDGVGVSRCGVRCRGATSGGLSAWAAGGAVRADVRAGGAGAGLGVGALARGDAGHERPPMNRRLPPRPPASVLRLTHLGRWPWEGAATRWTGLVAGPAAPAPLHLHGFMLCFAATAATALLHTWAGRWRRTTRRRAQAAGGRGRVSFRSSAPAACGGWAALASVAGGAGAADDGPRLRGAVVAHRCQRPGAVAAWAQRPQTLLLCVHLGAVLALFATLPYGKFRPWGVSHRRAAAPRGGAATAQHLGLGTD